MLLLRARTILSASPAGNVVCKGGAMPRNGWVSSTGNTSWLWLGIAVACCWIACAEEPESVDTNRKNKGIKSISIDEVDRLRAEKTPVVLDVRAPSEFALGHIPGAV